MKRFILFLTAVSVSLSFLSCSSGQKALTPEGYKELLYGMMAFPDSIVYPESYWDRIVAKTLETREKMDWGIPEREFRHFVLPVRVNNEDLDEFRLRYADELCDRVSGMNLYDAILEINHWCHEKVTYIGTDFRTRGPLALMATGAGRCGEESTFTVSALRAAGIPARQVYTPRWAHTDDNHAWVEAWVDGKWYFLGACEPAPALNWGWFNDCVPRALLLHTKVPGDYRGDEDVIRKNSVYTEINVIRNYVNTRHNVITVVREDGSAVAGVSVEYKIFNYQEFCTVCRTETDNRGRTGLHTGVGDMLVWAAAEGKFGFAKLDREEVTIVLDYSEGDAFSLDFNIIPPYLDAIPKVADKDKIEECDRRLAVEDSIRKAEHQIPACKAVLDAFLKKHESAPDEAEAARIIVGGLSSKDRGQMTEAVLEDALGTPLSLDPYVLAPRVEFEMLYPYKAEIRSGLKDIVNSPEELLSWVKTEITLVKDGNPQNLKLPPVFVWRSRMADRTSLKIFFVAACRALGFPSRYEYATAKAQYRLDGKWMDVSFDDASVATGGKGLLEIRCDAKASPEYFRDFTLAKFVDGSPKLLDYEYGGHQIEDGKYVLDEGCYLITSGTRLDDGSVLAHISSFNVLPDRVNEVQLVIRSHDESPLDILGRVDFLSDVCDRDQFILAVVARNGEPTMHAIRQLEGNGDAVILSPGSDGYEKVKAALARLGDADPNDLPFVIVGDREGNVYYYSKGYNTNLKQGIDRVFPLL